MRAHQHGLTLNAQNAPASNRAFQRGAQQHGSGMHCLIVEDEPIICMGYIDALDSRGHTCQTADSVERALYVLKTQHFDVIIIDFNLKDGVASPLVDYLALARPDTPIILATGAGVYPNGEFARMAPNITYVLRKPILAKDLCAMVEYVGNEARPETRQTG